MAWLNKMRTSSAGNCFDCCSFQPGRIILTDLVGQLLCYMGLHAYLHGNRWTSTHKKAAESGFLFFTRKYTIGYDVKLTWNFALKIVLSTIPGRSRCMMSSVISILNGRLVQIVFLRTLVFWVLLYDISLSCSRVFQFVLLSDSRYFLISFLFE